MLQNPTPHIVLASASVARHALLTAAGIAFTTEPARVDEDAVKQSARTEGATVEETALLLADMKAARVARRHPDALVIGADQILICGEAWFTSRLTSLRRGRNYCRCAAGRMSWSPRCCASVVASAPGTISRDRG